jgi:hypothetical protein
MITQNELSKLMLESFNDFDGFCDKLDDLFKNDSISVTDYAALRHPILAKNNRTFKKFKYDKSTFEFETDDNLLRNLASILISLNVRFDEVRDTMEGLSDEDANKVFHASNLIESSTYSSRNYILRMYFNDLDPNCTLSEDSVLFIFASGMAEVTYGKELDEMSDILYAYSFICIIKQIIDKQLPRHFKLFWDSLAARLEDFYFE